MLLLSWFCVFVFLPYVISFRFSYPSMSPHPVEISHTIPLTRTLVYDLHRHPRSPSSLMSNLSRTSCSRLFGHVTRDSSSSCSLLLLVHSIAYVRIYDTQHPNLHLHHYHITSVVLNVFIDVFHSTLAFLCLSMSYLVLACSSRCVCTYFARTTLSMCACVCLISISSSICRSL